MSIIISYSISKLARKIDLKGKLRFVSSLTKKELDQVMSNTIFSSQICSNCVMIKIAALSTLISCIGNKRLNVILFAAYSKCVGPINFNSHLRMSIRKVHRGNGKQILQEQRAPVTKMPIMPSVTMGNKPILKYKEIHPPQVAEHLRSNQQFFENQAVE